VICTARIALAGDSGCIVTTMGPPNAPDAAVPMLVLNIDTLHPFSTWCSAKPSARRAHSNEKEQPMTNATRSSRQTERI